MTDERIISIRRQMADLHKTRENYTEQWRRSQLMSLKRMIFENKAAMVEAIGLDLGRHPFETETGEIACTITDIEEILGILSDYIDPVQVASPAFFASNFFTRSARFFCFTWRSIFSSSVIPLVFNFNSSDAIF